MLIGFGRVLTDFVYRATIWDVIVDKTFQKQGIGTEIVQRILNHPRLKRVELFWLCTRRPGFYDKLGFSSKEQTGMVWSRSKQRGRNRFFSFIQAFEHLAQSSRGTEVPRQSICPNIQKSKEHL